MGGIGITELLVVLGIVLVIFGGRRLPQLGRDLGAGMRGFKDSVTGKDQPELPERTDADTGDQAEPVVDGEVVRDRS
jgi:sec-independent protein translocase protein TatA